MTQLVMRYIRDWPGPPYVRPLSTLPPPKPLPVPVGSRGKDAVNAPFESLPWEILHQIFELLDVEQLRSLVHASHVFHAHYRHHRVYLLSKCLTVSITNAILDPTGVPVLSDGAWSYHHGGRFQLYKHWRARALRILSRPKCTRLEIIDTATMFFYFVVPLERAYNAYKEALEAGIEESCYDETNNSTGLSSRVQRRYEDLGTYLRCFYFASTLWRQHHGLGYLKRLFRRDKSLGLTPEDLLEVDVMIFDDD